MEIKCTECSGYDNGVCIHGFPMQYTGEPVCLKDGFSELSFRAHFDDSGLPLRIKMAALQDKVHTDRSEKRSGESRRSE